METSACLLATAVAAALWSSAGSAASATGRSRQAGAAEVGDQPLSDMWQWDGRRWSAITFTGAPPGPRFAAAMVYDIERARVVLYGGRRDDKHVWEWNGRQWNEIRVR